MKKALITGITGQDGSYLDEFLLCKGYEIHGLIRRASTFNTERIDHLYKDFHDPDARVYLHYGDLCVSGQLTDLLQEIRPDEVYHLGAQSHVRVSFDMPEYTGDVTGLGTIRLLEAIRKTGCNARFYQASSSEMFGAALPPQSEATCFQPQSPYAAAKVYAYYVVRNYRDAYKIFAAMESSSTTNPRAAARPSLLGRLPALPPGSSLASRINSILETSMQNATGALPGIMSRRCG